MAPKTDAGIPRHLLAAALLPGTVVIVVPAVLSSTRPIAPGWGLPDRLAVVPVLLGLGLLVIGTALVAWTIALFVTAGRGTLAPWDPTSRLVVRGPYRFVRNPMLSGVLFLLLGEATLLGSMTLLAWFAIVAAANVVYLPLVEEPGLAGRYGSDYERYRANVPRWLPRRRAWDAAEGASRQPPP